MLSPKGVREPVRSGALLARVLVVAALGLAAISPARADRATEREAARLFERSAVSYQAGRYLEAAELLRELYARRPAPVLLFNRARALEKAGKTVEAISEYERYVQAAPDAPDRRQVEAHLATLRSLVDQGRLLKPTSKPGAAASDAPPSPSPLAAEPASPAPAAAPAAAPSPPAPADASPAVASRATTPRPRWYRRWWVWTTLGGVAAAGLAIGLGVGLTRTDPFDPTLAPIARP